MSRNTGTITLDGHPFREDSEELRGPIAELCLVWSLDEPERIGETALVPHLVELGRGLEGSGAPRLVWSRHRARTLEPRPPLQSRRISRVQLLVEPHAAGVYVRQLGRTPLAIAGEDANEGVVPFGSCFAIQGAATFLVDARTSKLERESSAPSGASYPFGVADEDGIVGESEVAWQLRERIALLASTARPLLILGESGTGKELVARALHRHSSRSSGPFVARNAATLPEGIADAELFGSVRGFPHAGAPERPGLVGQAESGTLFLDEIGELPQALQAHLLRLLDAGAEYQRLGEARTRRADVRFVAATNRPVAELKHDLAARFALRVETTPLGSRLADVPLLIQHLLRQLEGSLPMLGRFAFEDGDGIRRYRVTSELVERVLGHRFRTHSRELEQILLEAAAHSPRDYLDVLGTSLSEPPAASESGGTLLPSPGDGSELPSESRRFDEVSKEELERALAESEGNVTRASASLGLKNRYVLLRLMKKFGLVRER